MLRKSGRHWKFPSCVWSEGTVRAIMTSCEDWRSRKEAKKKTENKNHKPVLELLPSGRITILGPKPFAIVRLRLRMGKLMSRSMIHNDCIRFRNKWRKSPVPSSWHASSSLYLICGEVSQITKKSPANVSETASIQDSFLSGCHLRASCRYAFLMLSSSASLVMPSTCRNINDSTCWSLSIDPQYEIPVFMLIVGLINLWYRFYMKTNSGKLTLFGIEWVTLLTVPCSSLATCHPWRQATRCGYQFTSYRKVILAKFEEMA